LGELSQQAVAVLGPDFSHRLQQIKKKKKRTNYLLPARNELHW
jgi:hypothetical protein